MAKFKPGDTLTRKPDCQGFECITIKSVDDKWESDRDGNITLRVTVGVDMDLLKETIDKNKESDKDL